MTEQTPAPIGHNAPPPDPLKVRTEELVKAANQWAATEIKDQDNADSLSAFIDQLRAQEKVVEQKRKTEKQPHLDAAAKVDAEWNPLKDLIGAAKRAVEPRLTAWLKKLADEKAERDRLAKAEADRLAEIAAEAAQKAADEAAKSGDMIGATVAAEAAQKAADEAAKSAEKQASAPVNFKSSVGARTKSLRTYWHARVTSHAMALVHFKNHPKVVELIAQLAEQSAGEGVDIPGVEIWKEEKAA